MLLICLLFNIEPQKPGDVDPELMISFTDMIPLLPVRLKRYLHFGYKFKYDHVRFTCLFILNPIVISYSIYFKGTGRQCGSSTRR